VLARTYAELDADGARAGDDDALGQAVAEICSSKVTTRSDRVVPAAGGARAGRDDAAAERDLLCFTPWLRPAAPVPFTTMVLASVKEPGPRTR